MSKIKELLKDKESILVFDIDGVLALLELGEYNHFDCSDEEWFERCANGINNYNEDKVINKMKNFLLSRDMSKVYVITVIGHDNEGDFKKIFANKYYNIPLENIYYVKSNKEKKDILLKIKNKHLDVEDNKIVMIDDTISVLNDIMLNTNFSTVHISSFLDI